MLTHTSQKSINFEIKRVMSLFEAPKLWNSLSNNITSDSNFNSFYSHVVNNIFTESLLYQIVSAKNRFGPVHFDPESFRHVKVRRFGLGSLRP